MPENRGKAINWVAGTTEMSRGELAKSRFHVEQRAAVVVAGLPVVGFAGGFDRAVCVDGVVPAALFFVGDEVVDEAPREVECFPVAVGFLAEVFVHEEEGVETFGLGPPDFFEGVGLLE